MKQHQCQFTKDDLTKCTSFAMNGSDFCYRHNPDISEEEKINASSKGGSNSHSDNNNGSHPLLSFGEEGWGGEAVKIENFRDIVSVLADTINNVRSGKISQKSGSTIGYLSFIMLMAMDKAKSEEKQEKIDKLKAEGKWRPKPKYSPKFYSYKDDFFLDKDGKHLIVEKDGSGFHPELIYKLEEVLNDKKKTTKHKNRKRKERCNIPRKLTPEEHKKLIDDPNYHNFSNLNNPEDDEYQQQTIELLKTLKEGMDERNEDELKKSEVLNTS